MQEQWLKWNCIVSDGGKAIQEAVQHFLPLQEGLQDVAPSQRSLMRSWTCSQGCMRWLLPRCPREVKRLYNHVQSAPSRLLGFVEDLDAVHAKVPPGPHSQHLI